MYNISREEFVQTFLINGSHYLPNDERVETLRPARIRHNKFMFVVSKNSYSSTTFCELCYSSCKTTDKVVKEATASLPIRRLNKTLIACGANFRIQ